MKIDSRIISSLTILLGIKLAIYGVSKFIYAGIYNTLLIQIFLSFVVIIILLYNKSFIENEEIVSVSTIVRYMFFFSAFFLIFTKPKYTHNQAKEKLIDYGFNNVITEEIKYIKYPNIKYNRFLNGSYLFKAKDDLGKEFYLLASPNKNQVTAKETDDIYIKDILDDF